MSFKIVECVQRMKDMEIEYFSKNIYSLNNFLFLTSDTVSMQSPSVCTSKISVQDLYLFLSYVSDNVSVQSPSVHTSRVSVQTLLQSV